MVDPTNIRAIIDQLRDIGGSLTPPDLPPGPPRATSDGMDPWQQSVEKRLDSLDSRAQRLEATASDIREKLATLTERVTHLPTKGWMVTTLGGALGVIAALIAFGEKLQALVK